MTTNQNSLPEAGTTIEPAEAARPLPGGLRAIPGSIWALGFVSMFADISSEIIHSLLPVFLVSVLGASTLAVGLIEGIAESTALITKVFSGALSDYLGRLHDGADAGEAFTAAFGDPAVLERESVRF